MILLTELDRTFFEYLRLRIIQAQRLPDWRNLTGTLEEKRTAYRAAKENINRPIEVIGYGNAVDRGTKYANTIILDRKTILEGSLGGFKTFVTQDNIKFKERPKTSKDIVYEVRFFSENIFDFNLLENIVVGLFTNSPYFKYISPNAWDLTGANLFTQYTGLVDISDNNFNEKVLTFAVKDVFLDSDLGLRTAAPLNSISFDVYAYFNGELNNTNDTASSQTVTN